MKMPKSKTNIAFLIGALIAFVVIFFLENQTKTGKKDKSPTSAQEITL